MSVFDSAIFDSAIFDTGEDEISSVRLKRRRRTSGSDYQYTQITGKKR